MKKFQFMPTKKKKKKERNLTHTHGPPTLSQSCTKLLSACPEFRFCSYISFFLKKKGRGHSTPFFPASSSTQDKFVELALIMTCECKRACNKGNSKLLRSKLNNIAYGGYIKISTFFFFSLIVIWSICFGPMCLARTEPLLFLYTIIQNVLPFFVLFSPFLLPQRCAQMMFRSFFPPPSLSKISPVNDAPPFLFFLHSSLV